MWTEPKRFYHELKAAGDNTKKVHVVTSSLRGLPSHYRMIVTAMNANDKPLTFDYVLPKLLSEEQHVRRHDGHGTAFLAVFPIMATDLFAPTARRWVTDAFNFTHILRLQGKANHKWP